MCLKQQIYAFQLFEAFLWEINKKTLISVDKVIVSERS